MYPKENLKKGMPMICFQTRFSIERCYFSDNPQNEKSVWYNRKAISCRNTGETQREHPPADQDIERKKRNNGCLKNWQNRIKSKEKETKNETKNTTTTPEIKEEPKKEEIKVEEPKKEEETDDSGNVDIEKIWIKPTVTCTDFTANVYTAFANLSISDPSRVIYKAITFTFYKDNEIAFRVSSANPGEISAVSYTHLTLPTNSRV